MDESLIQKFGYSEMYEWSLAPNVGQRFGRLVQFDLDAPGKIKFYDGKSDELLGVTTCNTVVTSDNPEEWPYMRMTNEYGDLYLKEETIAIGVKEYDQQKEMSYISTKPYKHYIPIVNERYVKDAQYVQRVNRNEWARVNMLGKCLVVDNGTCVPGEYCQPYKGDIVDLQGTVVPYNGHKTKHQWLVLSRYSDKTIMICYK